MAVGYSALSSNISGNDNVAIGFLADRYNGSGSENVIIGCNAGNGGIAHNKSGNVFIGYFAGYHDTTSNKLYIENSSSSSPLIYGEFDNDLITISGNLGLGTKYFGNGDRTLALSNGSVPYASISNGVLLYSQDASSSSELRVRDEAGNITALSPHNFSMTNKSEPMAWSYYSENADIGKKINVDMLKTVRLIEKITGEKLAFVQDIEDDSVNTNVEESTMGIIEQQQQDIDELRKMNAKLLRRIEILENK